MWLGQSEPTAERRRVPFWLVQSNGTTPAQLETGNRPQWSLNGSAFTAATNTLSSVSSLYGRYYLQLEQSELSVPGVMMIRYSSTTCFEQGAEGGPVQITPNNPYNPQYMSQQTRFQSGSISTAVLASGETNLDGYFAGAGIFVEYGDGNRQFNIISSYTGSTKFVTFLNPMARGIASTTSYWIIPGTTSTVSVPSIATLPQAVWEYTSGKTVDSVGTVGSVTTVQSVNTVNTVLSVLTVNSTLSATVANITPSAETSLIRSWLSFVVGNGRMVQEYLWPMRNKVESDYTRSVVTVYGPDDATVAWVASTQSIGHSVGGFTPQ
jgi:hypothetical protein